MRRDSARTLIYLFTMETIRRWTYDRRMEASEGALGSPGCDAPVGSPIVLADVELLTDELSFPEGPIALSDGSLIVVQMDAGVLTQVSPGGTLETVAECGGGPNGAAIGPDGAVYVCNNGGRWPDHFTGARIERVDPDRGTVETLYTACDDEPLSSPNDLVFDLDGNFWFTDTGKFRGRDRDYGRVYFVGGRRSDREGSRPLGQSEWRRALARRPDALLRRDPHRPDLPSRHSRAWQAARRLTTTRPR